MSEELKSLFSNYKKLSSERDQILFKVNEATRALSDAVKAIAEKFGKGPYEFEGQTIIIVKRGETWFFKGRNQKSIRVDEPQSQPEE